MGRMPWMIIAGMIALHAAGGAEERTATLENESFSVTIDRAHGLVTSLVVKPMGGELLGEARLASNFRIGLPLPEYQCHYLDGAKQSAASVERTDSSIEVRFSGMISEKGSFPLDLVYTVTLDGDTLRFRARLTNNSATPVSEFWFPRLGGWTGFGEKRDALLATPNYIGCAHGASLFRGFPGGRGLGAEAAEFASGYPGMVMPWWDLYDASSNRGLYMGYHDTTFRLSTWHCYLHPNTSGVPGDLWLTPEQAGGAPVGIVFSHVRYPYIASGETLDSGEFVLRAHRGDWHEGAKGYRTWFLQHFPVEKSASWLRKQSAWFTSILYQPEDRVVADYATYDQWCKDAQACNVNCYELIGWDKGGIERDYPDYTPEEKLGGREGFQNLLESIDGRGGHCLVFANYNVMDSNTAWYRNELFKYTHQDTFGKTPNWMAWGESTLTARLGLSVRRHVLASVVPGFEAALEGKLLERVKDGAHAFQLDKVVAGSALDFNPLNTLKPDVALCEGLVQGMARLLEKCRAIQPDFRFASEACQDRLIPFVDVFYRNGGYFDIAPLRYVFPEWTSCFHVGTAGDFNGVNSAVVTGGVICVEPDSYQNTLGDPQYKRLGDYIREVERIRGELADTVFLGAYHDALDARVTEVSVNKDGALPKYVPAPAGALPWRVHGHRETDRRALVVANATMQDRSYFWEFLKGRVKSATVYEPFQPVRETAADQPVTIKGQSVQILIEQREEYADNLKLYVRCGIPPNEIIVAKDGYDAAMKQGFTSAWGPKWEPPVYHCRADEKAVKIDLTVPQGARGTLRLYIIDPDRFYGGRQEEIKINGASLGLMEDFVSGKWIDYPMTGEMTQGGLVSIEVVNARQEGNCVVSLIEWVE